MVTIAPDWADMQRRRTRIARAVEGCALRAVRWPVLLTVVATLLASMVTAAVVAHMVAQDTVSATTFRVLDVAGNLHRCTPVPGRVDVFTCD